MKGSRLAVVGLTIFVWTLLTGCSSQPAQVSQVAPQERHLRSETLDMRNCDSNDVMRTTLAAEAPVVYRVAVANEATLKSTGEVVEIPSESQAVLEDEIVSAYRQIYKGAVVNAEQVELTIPAHMIHMYDIRWTEQVYSSTVSFSMENQACTAEYTYALDIPDLESHTIMACTA